MPWGSPQMWRTADTCCRSSGLRTTPPSAPGGPLVHPLVRLGTSQVTPPSAPGGPLVHPLVRPGTSQVTPPSAPGGPLVHPLVRPGTSQVTPPSAPGGPLVPPLGHLSAPLVHPGPARHPLGTPRSSQAPPRYTQVQPGTPSVHPGTLWLRSRDCSLCSVLSLRGCFVAFPWRVQAAEGAAGPGGERSTAACCGSCGCTLWSLRRSTPLRQTTASFRSPHGPDENPVSTVLFAQYCNVLCRTVAGTVAVTMTFQLLHIRIQSSPCIQTCVLVAGSRQLPV